MKSGRLWNQHKNVESTRQFYVCINIIGLTRGGQYDPAHNIAGRSFLVFCESQPSSTPFRVGQANQTCKY